MQMYTCMYTCMYMHVYFCRPVDVSLYRFDSNCITPGTEFMVRLHEQLKYFVNQKVATDHSWQSVEVVLSGQEVGRVVCVCVRARDGECVLTVCVVIHVYSPPLPVVITTGRGGL